MTEKQKYNFSCLEQKCPQRVCCTREHINVTFGDLARWTEQNYLSYILPGIIIRIPQDEEDVLSFETLRKPLEADDSRTSCIFFEEKENACRIRYSRPISCQTFPLKYNGKKYIISDKNCAGIGKGEVTREALADAKELAENEYTERSLAFSALPSVYTIIMGQMIRQSAETMKNLSEEDRKKLEEIMGEKGDKTEQDED